MMLTDAALRFADWSSSERPRVTQTWEGYTSFAFRFGQRIVIKGATADELRNAYRLAVAA